DHRDLHSFPTRRSSDLLLFFLAQFFAAIGHGDAELGEMESMAVLVRGNESGDLAVELGHGSHFLAFRGKFLKYADSNGDAADQDDHAQRGVGDGQTKGRWITHQRDFSFGREYCKSMAMLRTKELIILIWKTCRKSRRICLDFLREERASGGGGRSDGALRKGSGGGGQSVRFGCSNGVSFGWGVVGKGVAWEKGGWGGVRGGRGGGGRARSQGTGRGLPGEVASLLD